MAQPRSRLGQQAPQVEEAALPANVGPVDGEFRYIRFAFVVWLTVFSILAASIVWDSVYGLLFRHPPM